MGAERDTYRELLLASCGAREHEARDVAARDEEHKPTAPMKIISGVACFLRHEPVVEPAQPHAPAAIRSRELLRDPRGDAVHLAPRLLERYARREPPDHEQAMIFAIARGSGASGTRDRAAAP